MMMMLTEQQLLLGGGGALASSDAGPGMDSCITATPPRLVDSVKPGPSGTIASTAAAATAAQAARLQTGPLVAPIGLLAATTPRHQRTHNRGATSTAMQDLVRAAEKALASGLGDWHLQSLQDVSPLFEQHVLMGALGPETLKHTHRLPEPQILHLYGLLHRHSTGFQREVAAALDGVQHREQLLAGVWTAFAQLWDECVQVSFEGEVLVAVQELQATYEALLDTQDALAAVQQENGDLKARCADFVRANLDHMLAWRSIKAKADALEGEVAMFSAANSEVSRRSAGVAARNTQLTVQLEGQGARLASAEQAIQEREGALSTARAALLEKDSGLRQLQARVDGLEAQVGDGQTGSRRLDGTIRELQAQLAAKGQAVQDAERRVADKARAFNLLHADFAKQKAEAADAAQHAQQLQGQLRVLQQQLVAAQQEAGKALAWRQRWECAQMHVEDLAAADARARQRWHELVSSYWPVMARLNLAEDAVAALSKQLLDAGQQPAVQLPPRDSRAQWGGEGACTAAVPAGTGSGSSSSTGAAAPPGPVSVAQEEQQQQQQKGTASDPAAQPTTLVSDAAADSAGVQGELHQLRESYLLLQDEYWRQKKALLGLEVEAGQLRAAMEQAEAAAAQVASALSHARKSAAREASERVRLEADLVGCKSWIRELERTEQQYLATIRQQDGLEQAATAAQRHADDLRGELAAVGCSLRLAQAAGAAASTERDTLLTRLTEQANRSNLVEQALQRVHKQEVATSRAARAQLQHVLEQRGAELQAARGALAQVQQERDTALRDQQGAVLELQRAQQGNEQLQQQLSKARTMLLDMRQRLESLETRVSFSSSSSSSSSLQDCCGGSSSVAAAGEAALHLLERVLVFLQCLAADAGTISNAAAASKVEVLVDSMMTGLAKAAAAAAAAGGGSRSQPQQQQHAAGVLANPATGIVLLRNAAGAAGKQHCQELEQQLSALQLALGDTAGQLAAANSNNSRLQRALHLKTRAVASLERQLGAVELQLVHAQAGAADASASATKLQQELTAVRMERAQLRGTCTARAGELSAALSRAGVAEAGLQQLQAAGAAAEASLLELTAQLQAAVEASRRDGAAAVAARAQAAAAVLQAEQLAQQLEGATARAEQLASEVGACRLKADICAQAARDAEYRAVETTTLLADARREMCFVRAVAEAAR